MGPAQRCSLVSRLRRTKFKAPGTRVGLATDSICERLALSTRNGPVHCSADDLAKPETAFAQPLQQRAVTNSVGLGLRVQVPTTNIVVLYASLMFTVVLNESRTKVKAWRNKSSSDFPDETGQTWPPPADLLERGNAALARGDRGKRLVRLAPCLPGRTARQP